MWSEELTELSEEYLNYDGVNVKTKKGDFGILNKGDKLAGTYTRPNTDSTT